MQAIRSPFVIAISALFILSLLCSSRASSEYGDLFLKDYQDPAGDVFFYNNTNNGTIVERSGLDIKWIRSSEDGKGNVLLEVDLKGKDEFILENNTKYVIRIFSAPDNSTGLNIQYCNSSAELCRFNGTVESNRLDFTSNVSINHQKDDNIMEVEVNISMFLSNISFFNIDAYSMMTVPNATYLDFICQLPGHPEYIDPTVEENEELDGRENDSPDSGTDFPLVILLLIVPLAIMVVIAALIITIILINFKKIKNKLK